MRAPFSRPNHLLKSPSSNTLTLGVRIPTCGFGEDTDFQTIVTGFLGGVCGEWTANISPWLEGHQKNVFLL